MRFTESFLDEIRAKLPVSEIVRGRVALKKSGREWKGLSPFAAEKTPSFFVNDAKGFYHCFSSGKHGDQFRFLMELDGVTFREAVEILARKAGVPIPENDPEAERRSEQRKSLREVLEAACKFFEQQLQENAEAREYLTQRGIDAETTKIHRLGYAPPGGELKKHLAQQGVDVEAANEAGLLYLPDSGGGFIDYFRKRVMFPVTDLQNRVVGFGARAMGDEQPKYLNSPETPTFRKGGLLYNAHRARRAAYGGARLIVAEGYAGAIALDAVGAAAVATLGTAVSADQLQMMWRWTEEPVFCFDGDEAGKRATARVAEIAMPLLASGRSVRFAAMPTGMDPDDLIRAEGQEAMDAVLDHAVPLADLIWAQETKGKTFDTPEAKSQLEGKMRELVKSIADPAVRKHYGLHYAAAFKSMWAKKPVQGFADKEFKSKFGRLRWRDVDSATAASDYRWMIKDILPLGETAMWVGRGKSGKSFECMNANLHVSLGWEYRGKRVERGLVVYCASEGGRGFKKRLQAFKQFHQLKDEDVPFEVLTRRFNLFATDDDMKALIEEIQAIAAEWAPKWPLVSFVIDTVSSVTTGWKENHSEDVSRFRSRVTQMEEALGVGAQLVHHTNAANDKSRGHTSLEDDIDTVLKVKRKLDKKDNEIVDDDNRVIRIVTVDKQREGQDGFSFEFVLPSVEVGRDEFGDAITSCVSREPRRAVAEDDERRPKSSRPTDGAQLRDRETAFFKALLRAVDEFGVPPPAGFKLPASVKAVVEWRHFTGEYRRQVPNDDDSAKGKVQYKNRVSATLRQVREQLSKIEVIALDQVGQGDDAKHYVWPTGKRAIGHRLDWPPRESDFSKINPQAEGSLGEADPF